LFSSRARPHGVRWKLCTFAITIGFAGAQSRAQTPAYNEPYRPQVQFSPKKNRSNDPNVLVFFEGRRFGKADGPGAHSWTDDGKDTHCAISFNHLSAYVGPVLISWMNNCQCADKLPISPWRGQITIPRKLTVMQDKAGPTLVQEPAGPTLVQEPAGPTLVQEPASSPLRVLPAKTLESWLQGDSISADVLNTELPQTPLWSFSPGHSRTIGVRIYSDSDQWTERATTSRSARSMRIAYIRGSTLLRVGSTPFIVLTVAAMGVSSEFVTIRPSQFSEGLADLYVSHRS
jgi:Beta-fructosidases (levanase/invertase)